MTELLSGYPRQGSALSRLRKITKQTTKLLLICTLLGGGGAWYGIDAKIREANKQTPSGGDFFDALEKKSDRITDIYSQDGIRLDRLGSAAGEYVTIDKIHPAIIVCLLATEDKRFREHNGFDKQAIWGMLFDELRGKTRGGSTISSLLSKHEGESVTLENWIDEIVALIPSSKLHKKMRRFNQKIGERVQANKLLGIVGDENDSEEKIAIKLKVVEYFLNYGECLPGTTGIVQASHAAFGKDQSQLRADQAAALVGSFQNPRIYNLLQDDVAGQRKSEQRTDEVIKDVQRAVRDNAFPDFFLERFVNDVVNKNDLEKLKQYNTIGTVNKKWSKRLPSSSLIPYATRSLIKEANSIIRDQQIINNVDYGMSYEPNIADGGCKITTTINAKLQEGIINLIDKYKNEFEKDWHFHKDSLAMAVLVVDNKTGAVHADVRGRNYANNQIDFRLAEMELGSIVKYVVNGCALELGIIDSLETLYRDTAYTVYQEDYSGITDFKGRTSDNFSRTWSNDTLSIGKGSIVDSRNSSIMWELHTAAEKGLSQMFSDCVKQKFTLLGINLLPHQENNPQNFIGNIVGSLDAVVKMYMTLDRGGTFLSNFNSIASIRGPQDSGIYDYKQDSIRNPQEIVLFSPEIVAEMLPYFSQKAKNVLNDVYEQEYIKSGTGSKAHMLNMPIVVTVNHSTIGVRLGGITPKFAYGDKMDSTTKLKNFTKELTALVRLLSN